MGSSPLGAWSRLLGLPQVEGTEWWLVRWVARLASSPFGPTGSGQPRGILHLFSWVERVLDGISRPQTMRPGGIMRYQVGNFPAQPLPLPGQPTVRKGEKAIILHFDSYAIADIGMSVSNQPALVWRLMRTAKDDFAELARMVEAGTLPADIRIVWAETPIYVVMARLGFSIRPSPPSLRTPFARLYFLMLMAIYGREGVRPLLDGRSGHFQLGEAWMTVDELARHYGAR